MDKDSSIYVAGHTGLLGSSLVRLLHRQGYGNLLAATHAQLDLTDQAAAENFFQAERPRYVFLAAAMAGGIHRNKTYPAQMIHVNLAIQDNVIDMARRYGAEQLLFVASACSYPKSCPMPIKPQAILSAALEPTNEPFAVAKIAGIKMCQAYNAQYRTKFMSVIPATMFGPNDHFDENGHVVAALMARFHQATLTKANSVEVWGTGKVRREFIYVDDAAEAMIFLMDHHQGQVINIGSGQDTSISDLAEMIAKIVGFQGRIEFDTSRPDGMARRLLDSDKIIQLGWLARTPLAEALAKTYEWYLEQISVTR